MYKQQYTLTIVFNKDKTQVLMLMHNKQQMLNFIGGKVEPNESQTEASYRELFEETGISEKDIELYYVQTTTEEFSNGDSWCLYITTGVLKHDIELISEKDKLMWVSAIDTNRLLWQSFGDGNCLVFIRRAVETLIRHGVDFDN